MNKILIIQTAFIGDVILATSLIEEVAKKFPNSSIDFLLRNGNQSILKENPHINKTIIWNKKENKNLNLFKIILKIRKEKYDTVINIQRFFNSGLMSFCFYDWCFKYLYHLLFCWSWSSISIHTYWIFSKNNCISSKAWCLDGQIKEASCFHSSFNFCMAI